MAAPTRISGAQKPLIHNAGKLIAMAASTGAALVSIISFLYSYGVIGKSESHQTIGNLGATWVGLRPQVDTAYAVGDTIHLAATITDKNGAILVGAKPSWVSENPKVATVLNDGSVIAQVAGGAQRAIAGNLLPQAVVMRVTSRRARPVEGVLVKFRVADGQGSLEPASAVTDADGRVRTVWTLGDQPGRQTLYATVE